MNFITGEKIQFNCDHFICPRIDMTTTTPNALKYHPNKFVVYEDLNSEFDNKSIIFTYSHNMLNLNLLMSKLSYLKNPFTLVLHNSDVHFEEHHLILFEKIPKLKHIFAQNANVLHKNVNILPIGLGNSQWKHGNLSIINDVYNMNIHKEKDIFFNFKVNTNKYEREQCKSIMEKKNIPWIGDRDFKDYLVELKKHKYCISPVGNGIDCHRFWECLYLNVIPICKRNLIVEHYAKFFTIIILDNWDDLDIDDLINNYNGIMLTNELLDVNNLNEFIRSQSL